MAIFGLIGYPLEHSFSPKYMNTLFKRKEMSHYYEAFPLREDMLDDFFKNLKLFRIKGLNVTIPYKSRVITYMDGLSEDVEVMDACNVIDIKDGKLIAYNTDWYGFSKSLEIKGVSLKGKKAFIYGSGGAAKSVLYALAKGGARDVVFFARTPQKAMEMIDLIGDRYPIRAKVIQWEDNINLIKEDLNLSDIVVNTTPLGMYPHVETMPPIPDIVLSGKVFFDLVYNPLKTRFLEFASLRGAITISGIYMLMYQGAKALSIWLGGSFEEDVEEVFKELELI